MLTPMDMLFQGVNMKEIEYDIDNSMKSFHGWHSFEQAIIDGEYTVEVRNIISTMYVKAGCMVVCLSLTLTRLQKMLVWLVLL